MNKKYAIKIISVLLGVALIALIISFIMLLFDAIFTEDIFLFDNDGQIIIEELKETIKMVKWLSFSLCFILIPALICFVFAYFGNGKIFNLISAILCFFIVATGIAFAFVIRKKAILSDNIAIYTTVTTAIENFIEISAFAFIIGAFFIYNSVVSFIGREKKTKNHTVEQKNENN